MDSQEVGLLLQECLEAAEKQKGQEVQKPTEEQTQAYRNCRDGVCVELSSLLQDAEQMQWPFVPERWQYKQEVEASDKTNLSDIIKKHLQPLLTLLKASIECREPLCALSVIFLVDRFLYWTDESSRLLKITKVLHGLHPEAPVAPQLVIRQARVYLNSGKLQKAEYILSSLINNSGTTGCWVYQRDSDRALVQAVSVQVRGMILQKLGLWLEAAELIWASVVGYYALPKPDKKGIGTSLGLLANILVSMNDDDFNAFLANPDIDLALLGESSHRLLSAAQAAKMAVVYSQYTSLYVLTNVVSQGTSLLSYSFSIHCPSTLRSSYLLQAREAFEIGLLTKSSADSVTSIQELHTFLKAAYSLTIAHKWLDMEPATVNQAKQACKEALGHFYIYCNAKDQDKDALCCDIMHLIGKVKQLLRVEPFANADEKSYIPDSYRDINETVVDFNLERFSKIMQNFKKFHTTLCEMDRPCKSTKGEPAKFCITAMGTTVEPLNSNCSTEANAPDADQSSSLGSSWHKVPLSNSPRLSSGSAAAAHFQSLPTTETDDDQRASNLPDGNLARSITSSNASQSSSLGSSWHNFPLSNSSRLSSGSAAAATHFQSLPTTETDDDQMVSNLGNGNLARSMTSPNASQSSSLGSSLHKVPLSNSPKLNSESAAAAHIQGLPTAETDDDQMASNSCIGNLARPTTSSNASTQPLNLHMLQGALETLDTESESEKALQSLSDSYGSSSSWEKLSADFNSLRNKPMLAKVGSKSSESSESLFHLETLDSETSELNASSNQGNPNMNRNAVVSPKSNPIQVNQCTSTEPSTDNSFEMVDQDRNVNPSSKFMQKEKKSALKEEKNELCHSCLNGSFSNFSESHYILTENDYNALLSGVCHQCLLKRLESDAKFHLEKRETAYSALHLKFFKSTGLWTARETCVYIGEEMVLAKDKKGKQRAPLWVQFLHQEERLSSYVGKEYLEPKQIKFHLKDVERQMTAQYYVTEFNKSLYERDEMAQIFFIPSEALLILDGKQIVGCFTVEPYMLGDFVKLTNNTWKKEKCFKATEYGLAFGHFTYLISRGQEVVVDLQGWVTANGKGLTYLTDPQIHSTKTPRGPSNPFAERGLRYFLEEQHGPQCNKICNLLQLPPVSRASPLIPHSL